MHYDEHRSTETNYTTFLCQVICLKYLTKIHWQLDHKSHQRSESHHTQTSITCVIPARL